MGMYLVASRCGIVVVVVVNVGVVVVNVVNIVVVVVVLHFLTLAEIV